MEVSEFGRKAGSLVCGSNGGEETRGCCGRILLRDPYREAFLRLGEEVVCVRADLGVVWYWMRDSEDGRQGGSRGAGHGRS